MSDDAGTPDPAPKTRTSRRTKVLIALGTVFVVVAGLLVAAKVYVDNVGTPDMLNFPESTTVYYSDGKTVLARLGETQRLELPYEQLAESTKQTAVAARDPGFWTSSTSPITRDVARMSFDLVDDGYAAKLHLTVLAYRLDDEVSKEEILRRYLNTLSYGRNTYGIEAAANAYFGKTARSSAPPAAQLTTAEAIVLAAIAAQPNPTPDAPGFDPSTTAAAKANAERRFGEIRAEMVELGYLTAADAALLTLPIPMKQRPAPGRPGPSHLVVNQVLAELAHADGPFTGWQKRAISEGGYSIVTTIDSRLQRVAEAAANSAVPGSALYGQPQNLQAAAVVVQPGTGRVLAYYGGDDGIGADYAGIYRDDLGDLEGFGAHPPGTSFAPVTLAAALHAGISVKSAWSTNTRATSTNGVEVRDTAHCPPFKAGTLTTDGPCTLANATTSGLASVFYGVTTKIGPAAVINMAQAAGVDNMWSLNNKTRHALTPDGGAVLSPAPFDAAVGIGAYSVTVVDQANVMATFAAKGVRATAHFVAQVSKNDEVLYHETLPGAPPPGVLTAAEAADLGWALSQAPVGHVGGGITAAARTGVYGFNGRTDQNAHAWTVGYTRHVAVAVWVGNRRTEMALRDKEGRTIWGSMQPAMIFQRLVAGAYQELGLKFVPLPGPAFVGDPKAGNA